MGLFKQFRRPKWQHPDPAVRRAAIEALSDTETLLKVIDAEERVELVALAVERLPDPDASYQFLNHSLVEVRTIARTRRLEKLLPRGDARGLESLTDTKSLLEVADLTEDEAIREAAVARIPDETTRLDIACTHGSARVRWVAAQGIQGEGSLRELSKRSQAKDKRVFRFCKEQLKALRESEQALAAKRAQIAHWQETAISLAASMDEASLPRRVARLASDWEGMSGEALPKEASAAEVALGALCARVQEIEAIAQQAADAEAQAEAAAKRQVQIVESLQAAVRNVTTASAAADESATQPLQEGSQTQSADAKPSEASKDPSVAVPEAKIASQGGAETELSAETGTDLGTPSTLSEDTAGAAQAAAIPAEDGSSEPPKSNASDTATADISPQMVSEVASQAVAASADNAGTVDASTVDASTVDASTVDGIANTSNAGAAQEATASDEALSKDRASEGGNLGRGEDASNSARASTHLDPHVLATALATDIGSARDAWRAATAEQTATAALARRFEQQLTQAGRIEKSLHALARRQHAAGAFLGALQKMKPGARQTLARQARKVKDWLREIDWPQEVPAPALVSDLLRASATLSEKMDAATRATTSQVSSVREGLVELETHIEDGRIKQARALFSRLQERLREVEGGSKRSELQTLARLGGQLDSMRDWQTFATSPKKESLCGEMEALIDSKISVEARATKVRELQANWKELSVGADSSDRALWNRFKRAADKAYEPCREHFAALGAQRAANLATRATLCEELETFAKTLDSGAIDARAAQSRLNKAREAFREASPVERAEHRKSQQRFQAVAAPIQTRIKKEYDKNIGAKETLVEKALALAESEGSGAAIEAAKNLQAQWKAVGITPMSVDRKLWKAFRQACDAVFERRSQERDERRAATDQAISEAEQLVRTLEERLQAKDGATSAVARTDVADARKSLNELGLPKRPAQKLYDRLGALETEISERARAQRENAFKLQWLSVAQRLRACGERGSDAQTAQTLWDDHAQSPLPKGIDAKQFAKRWETGAVTTVGDESALRKLCIGMEILAGVDSPAADQDARMAYQIERLSQALGGTTGAGPDQRVRLVNAWLQESADAQWARRFAAALSACAGA